MMTMRQSLNQVVPGADLIKVPDTDEASALLVHPGVQVYSSGEQKSFLEKYSDYIYLSLFLASGVGSVAAGLFGQFGQRRRQEAMENVARLEAALAALRGPLTPEELDALEREVDDCVGAALQRVSAGDMDASGVAAFEIALAEVRRRIEAARMGHAAGQGPAWLPPSQVPRPDAAFARARAGS